MGKRTWSPEQDAIVRRLWTAEVCIAEIAHQVGKNEGSVKYRRMVLGLPPRRQRLGAMSYSLRLEKSLHDELRARARDRRCGLATIIRHILRKECGMN